MTTVEERGWAVNNGSTAGKVYQREMKIHRETHPSVSVHLTLHLYDNSGGHIPMDICGSAGVRSSVISCGIGQKEVTPLLRARLNTTCELPAQEGRRIT